MTDYVANKGPSINYMCSKGGFEDSKGEYILLCMIGKKGGEVGIGVEKVLTSHMPLALQKQTYCH